MSTNVTQSSFAAGELSPSMYGRTDLGKYHTGVALAENMIVDFKGGLFNRPGSQYVGPNQGFPASNSILIPFQFSSSQGYILEFSAGYIRFITNGGYVTEAPKNLSAITQASPGVFTSNAHGFNNGDMLFIAGVAGMAEVNKLFGVAFGVTANTFSLLDISGNPIDTSTFTAYVSDGTVSRVYTIGSPYTAADLQTLKYAQSADVMIITHQSYSPKSLNRFADANWTLVDISFASPIAAPGAPSGTATVSGASQFTYAVTAVDRNGNESLSSVPGTIPSIDIRTTAGSIYVDWADSPQAAYYKVYKTAVSTTSAIEPPVGGNFGWIGNTTAPAIMDDNITPDYTITPPNHRDPFAAAGIDTVTITAGGAGYTQATTSITVNTTTGTGAIITPIVRSDGVVIGATIVNPGSGYANTDTLTVNSSAGGAGATAGLTLTSATGNHPGTVGYFQQRRVYGSTIVNPNTLWMSQPGSFGNFDTANPVKDDDAITVTLAAKQINNIKYLVAMPGGLIVLTDSSAWQVSGGQQNQAVTPAQVVATPQAYTGCADVEPIVINYDILYVQSRGNVVRDLSYNFYVNIYTGIDISLLSNHLLIGYQLIRWAYTEEPYKVVWSVRNDGAMLSLTYLKEQEIYGWCQHNTYGFINSVASIVEGNENVLYMTVQRFIKGAYVSYTERMHTRQMPYGVEDSWFLDCAVTNDLTYPAATLTPTVGSGNADALIASAGVFNAGTDIGKIIRAGGGIATITAVTSSTRAVVNWTRGMTAVSPGDNPLTAAPLPKPQLSGQWSMTPQVSVFRGLQHLIGQTVQVVADGLLQNPKVVPVSGIITLDTPASKIVAGIPYRSKVITLPLDIGEPTVQGKRKKLAALNLKVESTQGIKISTYSPNGVTAPLNSLPAARSTLYTGTARIVMDPLWSVEGQVLIQQDQPFPFKLLAAIPEIVVGDSPTK